MKFKLFTIGFTKHSAENFFTKLEQAGVKRIIDTRLNPSSQLSGFSKKSDLSFFLRRLCHAEYQHQDLLAPEASMLRAYQSKSVTWEQYSKEFLDLLGKRKIEERLRPEMYDRACLLCSEFLPHCCHRRLVAEYLQKYWGNFEIIHL